MKYRNYISINTFLLLVVPWIALQTGCRKFVEIAPPADKLVTANVFADGTTATAALSNIYVQMGSNNLESFNIAQQNGFLADELKSFSTAPYLQAYYSNNMQTSLTNGSTSRWNYAYNYISQANTVWEGLKKNGGDIPSRVKNQLQGEAKFIRAFWFFYLANCFGDIPLATTSDYKVNASLGRTSRSKVYDQVIADLTEAESKLSSEYVNETDTAVTTERVRPTKWAAKALLARAYLYKTEYAQAEAQASLVISNSATYSLPADLNTVFLANSSEAIWQLRIPSKYPNAATFDGQYFILIAAPEPGVYNSSTISSQLLSAFEPGDQRKIRWIGSYAGAPDIFYFPYKYKQRQQSQPATEYTMVLRLAEQYLIRAEARAQLGNVSGALEDLNAIRNRAGLTGYAGATDKGSLLAAILHERQVELFAEWGHRWFDLIRTGNVNNVMSVVTPLKGSGTWNAYKQLYPIPLTEIQADINLNQNLGY